MTTNSSILTNGHSKKSEFVIHMDSKGKVKKCTYCPKSKTLIRLPEQFQQYSRQKGYDSYFCINCCNVVNYSL